MSQVKIISPEEMKERYPLSEGEREQILRVVREIEATLRGETGKLLLVLGPCSANEEKSVLEYTQKLKKLSDRVKDKFLCVPRVFTSKPRLKELGFRGILKNQDHEMAQDFSKELTFSREMHLRVFRETGFVAAEEMYFPDEFHYIDDIVGYAVIGARTSESALHRMEASGLCVPVGVKNPMSGCLPALARSVEVIQREQDFFRSGVEVHTRGNAYAHAILRGRVNERGEDEKNYGEKSFEMLREEFSRLQIENPAVLVDCNHSNSSRRPELQGEIAEEVLRLRLENGSVGALLRGLMIESFLKSGCDHTGKEYGKSVTDPCLGLRETEKLVLSLADKL